MSLLDELLAGYVGSESHCPEATPAKAANSAKSEHLCGPEVAPDACEGLRISAKEPPDSQLFADVRRPENTAQAQYPCGSSQVSQDSQGLPGTKASDVDPDRWCYPNSPAMNTGEIERFTARVDLFRRRGLSDDLAEAMADKLLRRDREGDDRRLCIECANLAGRRCTAWREAGIGDPDVSDLRTKLQRCDAFLDGHEG